MSRGLRWHPAAMILTVAAILALAGVLVLGLVDRGGWLWGRISRQDRVPAETVQGADRASRADFLAANPAFRPNPLDPTGVVLPPGVHDLGRTVVVPRGVTLHVGPGTTLRLGPGRSLIAYGPLELRGTAEAPVVFAARFPGLVWGAVAVMGAEWVTIEHTHFRDGRYLRLNGDELPGGISLIDTDGLVFDSRFERMRGKDGLYVRGGTVQVHDSLFQGLDKDGLDLDGAGGAVWANRFVDCGDEGIDLDAAASAEVFDNVVLDRRGGRIGVDDAARAANVVADNVLGYSGAGAETSSGYSGPGGDREDTP